MQNFGLSELGLFYCAAVWGSTFYLVKDVLSAVNPLTLIAYRFILSALLMVPWVISKKNPWRLLRESAVLAVLLTTLYASQTIGLGITAASNSGFITGLFILFVPVFLFIFFNQRPTAVQWSAVAIALAGLWILTGGVDRFNRGDALTLIAAIMYAAHLLATDRYVKRQADTVLLAFHQFWMTGAICFIVALATGCPLEVASHRAAGVILFLTLFPTLSAFFIQMIAQKSTPPVRVALILTFEPIFAAVFAWTLGGEQFRASGALGGGLIVAAMVMSELSKFPLKRAPKQEVLPI